MVYDGAVQVVLVYEQVGVCAGQVLFSSVLNLITISRYLLMAELHEKLFSLNL